jgi:hypothetical protein
MPSEVRFKQLIRVLIQWCVHNRLFNANLKKKTAVITVVRTIFSNKTVDNEQIKRLSQSMITTKEPLITGFKSLFKYSTLFLDFYFSLWLHEGEYILKK